ncbi:MAG: SAM-dependent methyltransferase [Pseudomonadota bacterium]
MSGFSAEWLTLREAADDRARDAALRDAVAARFDGALVADLGGGSGATLRVLGPLMPKARWRILDHDPALLALAPRRDGVETACVDLAARPEAAFEGAPRLVAASAFFDLASASWIDRFVEALAARRLPLYAALTYDGREEWRPEPPNEADGLAAFHADMRRDKGFGPALGPNAADRLESALRRVGYRVSAGRSDWRLEGPRDRRMIEALAAGGATAVEGALAPQNLAAWRRGREAAEEVVVGHLDIFAEP